VVVTFSHVSSSVSLLVRFFVAIPLSTVHQVNVEFSWLGVCRIPSVVSSLPVPIAKRCHLFPLVGPSPPKLHTLEQECTSHLIPLRFRCSPSLLKFPSSIQLFGSKIVTPRFFATQLSVIYSSDALTPHVSALQNATLNKSTVLKFRLSCSHDRVHFTHHTVQVSWS
jgi:hypothetical protein